MAKTITISEELEKDIYDFCDDELDWHINNCEPSEYKSEILAQIELLRLLGYKADAKAWKEAFEEACGEEDDDE